MYCPKCLTEYRRGFIDCADCRIPLVAGRAPNGVEPEDGPKLVGVLDTNDNFALASACAALGEAEIVYEVVAISDVPDRVRASNPKWWIPPSRIMVSLEDEGEARNLVEPFRQPLPDQVGTGQEVSSSTTQEDLVSPDAGGGRWGGAKFLGFGGTNAPLVQRIGFWIIGAMFITAGLSFLDEVRREDSFLAKFLSLGIILLGARIFSNSFLKRQGKT